MGASKLTRDNRERLLLAGRWTTGAWPGSGTYRPVPAFYPHRAGGVENRSTPAAILTFFGGCEGQATVQCAFLPTGQEAEDCWGTGRACPVRACGAPGAAARSLTHRDFLGSILGLGLDREKVGDLLVADGRCDVLAWRRSPTFWYSWSERACKTPSVPLCPWTAGAPAVETRAHPGHRSSPAAGRGGRLRLLPVPGAADLIASGRVQLNHRE